jgi:8-oxo-dGTP diphosphatase
MVETGTPSFSDNAPTATVAFLRRNGRLLLHLQERAPGRIWAGRLNGPGGKLEPGETPKRAVVREVAEETGLHLAAPMPHGALDLVFGDPARSRLLVHVFTCQSFTGRARGGREGTLRWYPEARLPYHRLWPDMRYWLPAVLDGGSVAGTCVYDETGHRLLACTLTLDLAATIPSPFAEPGKRVSALGLS